MKKIAIVHDFLFKLGGAERVVKTIADLFPEAPIYTLLYDEERCGSVFPHSRVIVSRLNRLPKWVKKHPPWFLASYPQIIEDFDFSSYELVISSSGAFSHGIITSPSTKHLCYCHSPMRYAWDYTHEYLQEKNLSWWQEYIVRKIILKIRQWDQIAADRPDQYIANSYHVARRLKKYFHIDAEVLYPPVEVDRFYPYTVSKDYFLIISALSSFKKIDLAISTFNKIGKRLLIIGEGSDYNRLKSLAGPTIHFLGRKNDEEVKQYLQSARALIFPGEEDFGITPVEALACGKPVVAYRKGGVLETLTDGETGIFFSESNIASLESAMIRFFQQEYSFQPDVLRKQAEKFNRHYFQECFKKIVDSLI